ncbi:MAG: cupin domain-containing protein [Brevinematales bacterium]|jgi:mannose-6-phosphate isomerase-like protein (cupin superfamily)
MLIHPSEMRTELKEKMRGGEGTVKMTHLVEPEKLKNARLLARLTIASGSGIGTHEHSSETEYYIIQKGSGSVSDNGIIKDVKPGDVLITGNGDNHSIKNTGQDDLELIAVIILN